MTSDAFSGPLGLQSKPDLLRHPDACFLERLLDGEMQSPRRQNDDRQIGKTNNGPVDLSAGVDGRDVASKEGEGIEKSTQRNRKAN